MTFAELFTAARAIVPAKQSMHLECGVWSHVHNGKADPPDLLFEVYWEGCGKAVTGGTAEETLERLRGRFAASPEPETSGDIESVGDCAIESAVPS